MSQHTDKYDALIEKMGGLDRVKSRIPFSILQIKKALANGDIHLNTLPLSTWDRACDMKYNAGVSVYGGEWSVNTLAERVCLLKRAAERAAN